MSYSSESQTPVSENRYPRPLPISIAMATYNGAKYLEEQLASFVAQSQLPYELMVCDDGSTDATLEILDRFAHSAPFPVRIVCNEERLGHVDNFLKAANLCEGDWIAYSDQDDVWLPDKLRQIGKTISRFQDVALVIHAADMVDADLRPLGKTLPPLRRAKVFGYRDLDILRGIGDPHGFRMCFRKELIGRSKGIERPLSFLSPGPIHRDVRWVIDGHDRWIFMISSVFGNVVAIPEVLALYRRHVDAMTFESRPEADAFNLGRRLLKVYGYSPEAYARRAEATAAVADSLEKFSTKLSPPAKARCAHLARRMRRHTKARRARANFYSGGPRNWGARFVTLARALVTADYWNRLHAGLGSEAFAKDFVYAIAGWLIDRLIGQSRSSSEGGSDDLGIPEEAAKPQHLIRSSK
jgi:glycosyltransferase involved in cell wall biosynthesis